MAGAVRDKGDLIFILARGLGLLLIQNSTDLLGDVQVHLLALATHIVGLAVDARVKNNVNGAYMIFHKEPVPHIGAGPVNGNGFSTQRLADNGGDELLIVLMGTVVIGTIGDERFHAVGMLIAAHQHVAGGLGRTVWAVGGVGRGLQKGAGFTQAAVYLIRGHMIEAAVLKTDFKGPGAVHPGLARHVQQGEGAVDVGADEGLRAFNGVVHMRLGGQVDDVCDPMLSKALFDEDSVADVALDEAVVLRFGHAHILQVGRVGELV